MIKVRSIAEGYFFFHWRVAQRFTVQNLTLPPSMPVAKVIEYVYYHAQACFRPKIGPDTTPAAVPPWVEFHSCTHRNLVSRIWRKSLDT